MISFRLTDAPASFQRYINEIFIKKLDIFVIVYLDDIFIYTNDKRDDHFTCHNIFLCLYINIFYGYQTKSYLHLFFGLASAGAGCIFQPACSIDKTPSRSIQG